MSQEMIVDAASEESGRSAERHAMHSETTVAKMPIWSEIRAPKITRLMSPVRRGPFHPVRSRRRGEADFQALRPDELLVRIERREKGSEYGDDDQEDDQDKARHGQAVSSEADPCLCQRFPFAGAV
jgi:hypothetical protein